jgi:hypothetical protein
MAALYLWPLLPFLAVLIALQRIAGKIGGRAAAIVSLGLGVLCIEILHEFAPGNIDHHNVQYALTLWTIAFLCEARDNARAGLYAALTCAVSLAIGLETLPYVAVAILVVVFLWIVEGEAAAAFARNFGLAICAAAVALLLGATAARYRFSGTCDTYSLFYAVPLIVGGAGLAGLARLGAIMRTRASRAVAVAGLALVTVALAGSIAPACLAGPYAQMDPALQSIFLARIAEAYPAFRFAHVALSEFVTGYVYAVFGLTIAFAVAFRAAPGARFAPAVLCAFAAMGLVMATAEFRAAPFAILAALPAIAAFIARVLLSRMSRGILAPIAALAAVLLLSDAGFALIGGTLVEPAAHVAKRIEAYRAQLACGSAEGMAPLARLGKGRVAGFVDQGPAVLVYTADSVVAGPYHRNAAGIVDSDRLFAGSPAEAAAVLKKRGIDYVMVCTASPDWPWYIAQGGHKGLIARIAKNRLPPWLRPAGRDETGHVRVYRVIKSRLP